MLKVLWALESLFAVLGLLLFARLVIIATQLLNRPTSVLPRVSFLEMSSWYWDRWATYHGKTCSVPELRDICDDVWGCEIFWSPCDRVYRDIYLGDSSIAQDVSKLKSLGVTHVLNAAHGAIDVSKEYEKVGIEYLGVPADDVPTYNLKQHFEPAAAFINTAVKKGKVLVHCHVGYSRSPTLVAAYLMLYQELTAQESITLIRGKRFIGPNDGFLRQLCEFNDQLVEEGRLELP
ncbi:dual specificity protein phosphatase 3-like isoform X4 [Branchiostoma floridae]|uniref:Dual specificity protein phosphatase n=1 Tax=Branchiostoma floridae TaxID=7739 RepID=A0A9J7KJ88_BRAFL|nr:dual specificity protein phosphatase 3-like isoform X4 [Branchiostoma floridae]